MKKCFLIKVDWHERLAFINHYKLQGQDVKIERLLPFAHTISIYYWAEQELEWPLKK